jgi:hypothetical protein
MPLWTPEEREAFETLLVAEQEARRASRDFLLERAKRGERDPGLIGHVRKHFPDLTDDELHGRLQCSREEFDEAGRLQTAYYDAQKTVLDFLMEIHIRYRPKGGDR